MASVRNAGHYVKERRLGSVSSRGGQHLFDSWRQLSPFDFCTNASSGGLRGAPLVLRVLLSLRRLSWWPSDVSPVSCQKGPGAADKINTKE